MRKIFADKLGLLRTSIAEISAAAPETRDTLLAKSFSEFEADIGQMIEEVAPTGEPLAKGLNLISSLASMLTQVETTVRSICEGKPYRYSDEQSREECPEHIQMGLHHFLAVGEMVLREMVNDHVEMPEDDMDAEKADRAGQLFKIDSAGDELLIKSALPASLVAFAMDPALLAVDRVALGRDLVTMGGEVLVALDEQGLLPPELRKAIPPEMGSDEEDQDESATDETADADDQGFDDGSDGDGSGDDGAGADDGSEQMDPMEVIVRLASAIMVVGGSIIQAQGGGAADDEGGMGADDAGADDGSGDDGSDMGDGSDEGGTETADADSAKTGGPGPAIHEDDDDGSTPEGESGQGATDHTADRMHRKNAAQQSAHGPAGSRALFSAGKKRSPDPTEKGTPAGALAKAADSRMQKLEEVVGLLSQGVAQLLQRPAASDKGHSGITAAIPRQQDGLSKSATADVAELAKTNPEAAATAMIRAQMTGR